MLRLLLLLSCCAISASALAAKVTTADSLSFRLGHHELEPQELPPFLHAYHSQALNLTSQALLDESLDYIPNVSYGCKTHQKLDVWKRKDAPPGGPIVVFVHGGGWDWGYREWAGFPAKHICKMDKSPVFVTPSYAIGKGERQMWPDARNDMVAVLEWIKSSAEKYGGNPSQVFLAGHSAGGHLAASVAMNPDLLREKNIDPSTIRGLFLISAPLGLRAQDFFPSRLWRLRFITRPFLKLLYRGVFLKVLSPVLGKRGENAKRFETAKEASPLFLLERMKEGNSKDLRDSLPDSIHYSFGESGDFPICKPQLTRLVDILGDKNHVQSLEIPVDSHFDTHFSLAEGGSQWYTDLGEAMSKCSSGVLK